MPLYAVVKQSTDMRHPETQVFFVRSLKRAKELRVGSGEFVYDDPDSANNYHRIFTQVYELPNNWRKPSQRELEREARENSTPTYPRNATDVLARRIKEVGLEIRLGGK